MGSQPAMPVAFDDGTSAMVPVDKIHDAVRDGGKIVQGVRFDDGSSAWVPLEKLHDAIRDGGTVIGAQPSRPNVNMQPVATFNNIPANPGANYDPNNHGPMGDLSGGRAGAYEQSIDVNPMSVPAAAVLTGAGALGAGPLSIGGHVAGAVGLTALQNNAKPIAKKIAQGLGLKAGWSLYDLLMGTPRR